MITLSLGQALLLYSSVLLAGAAAIWAYTEFSTRRTQRILGKQDLWRCYFCAYSYLDEEAETVSQCPRCQSFNAREDAHLGYAGGPAPALESTPEDSEARPRRNPSHRHRPGAKKRGPRRRRK